MSHIKFRTNGFIGVTILFLIACLSTTSLVASNKSEAVESDAAKIQRAIKAAPSNITDYATIMDADGSVLRDGSNGWVCFPGVPLNDGDKHPMCNDAVWMAWLAAVSEFFTTGVFTFTPSAVGISYMLLGDALVDNNNPASQPGDVGVWDQEGPHLMMLFPRLEGQGPYAQYAHLPRDPDAGGPYVMWDFQLVPGVSLIHVMVPLTDK